MLNNRWGVDDPDLKKTHKKQNEDIDKIKCNLSSFIASHLRQIINKYTENMSRIPCRCQTMAHHDPYCQSHL